MRLYLSIKIVIKPKKKRASKRDESRVIKIASDWLVRLVRPGTDHQDSPFKSSDHLRHRSS